MLGELIQIVLRPHVWKSGTTGWLQVGKVEGSPRYQAAVNVYVVDSKSGNVERPDGVLREVESLVSGIALSPRTWKSGTRGLWGQGRFTVGGVKLLADVSLFEIGSKPSAG